jgi:predicted RNA-binding protein with RPS1 domain
LEDIFMSEEKQAVAEQEAVEEATAETTQMMPAGSDELEVGAVPAVEASVESEPVAAVAADEPETVAAPVASEATPAAAAAEAPEMVAAPLANEATPAVAVEVAAPEVAVTDESVAETAVEVEPEPGAVETPEATAIPEVAAEVDETPVAGTTNHAVEGTADTSAAAPAGTAADASADGEDESKRVVRVLSVGQPVMGTVRRITDFGAFVDIGVGRDGLIHISELSARRVGKVTDVLAEGQEVQTWIKKLDRERNRISLTLIDPGTKTIRDLEKGDLVNGTVTRMMPYGAFIDIGIGRDALLHVREMGERYVAKPEDVVKVGEVIEARVIDVSRRRGRVDLSIKGLREEPEPEVMPEPATDRNVAEQNVPDTPSQPEGPADQFAEVEVLTPMELAFKRAMEAEGAMLDADTRKQSKRSKRDQSRMIQEEIMARTLSSPRK